MKNSGSSSLHEHNIQNSNYFTKILYQRLFSNKTFLNLSADKLQHNFQKKEIALKSLKGTFQKKNQKVVKFQSLQGFYSDESDHIKLSNKVRVERDGFFLKSSLLTYSMKANFLKASQDVITWGVHKKTQDFIKIKADRLQLHLSTSLAKYDGRVRGEVKRQKKYEEGLKFKSQNMTFDMPKNHIKLNKNVHITRTRLKATAMYGEIDLDSYSKKLKYLTLLDDIIVTETLNVKMEKMQRRATSEKLILNTFNNTLTLTGYPKIFYNEDIITGNIIILRHNTDVIEIIDSTASLNIDKERKQR